MLIVLLCKGQGVDSEELSSFNKEKVAGISLFERTLINLGSVGYNEAILICEDNTLPLKQLSERYPSFRIRAETSLDNLPREQDLLIIQNNVVINKKQLGSLLETISDENGSFIAHNSENKDLGILFLKEKDQEAFNSDFINLIQLKELLKKKVLMDPPKKITSSEIGTRVSSEFLFNHISKNVSGWISKNINSKVSIPISKILVRMNSDPNWVTFFVGCIGISCGFFYASNLPLIGALVLQLSTILDRCDGEVARIRLKESRFGQWFDTALDQLSYFSMLLGISMCINNPKFFTTNYEIIMLRQVSILNILLYIIFLTTILFFMIRRTKNGSLAYYPSEIDKITSIKRRSPIYRLMAQFRFLLKREYFCPGMILIAPIGYEFTIIASFALLFFGLIHLASDFLEVRKKIDITY